ncbi:MAG: tRNA epoxyqueuosine(34) reductase QueG [candidate division WOR-3 bacterium]|nr:MAG: tRNA epoxyqueuosine(34) reductase QueG [candidate division WOR-3 bacterium]
MIDARKIRTVGYDIGIDLIKITTAEPFNEAAKRIKYQIDEGLYLDSEHWHLRDVDRSCDVRAVLPGARSIIAACQCYLTDERAESDVTDDPHGSIARYTWRNHYSDLRERLKKLAGFLKTEYDANTAVFSNSEIPEKPIAQRSGIGYFGKNSLIINERFGSWVVLGEIIADIEIDPDPPHRGNCGDCSICVEMCPTHAIIEPYIIDRRRCIQALTNWYGVLPDDIARVWSNRLYGCTDCQDSCPANRAVEAQPVRAEVGYVGPSASLREILSMSEKEYRRKYARNQMTARWINFQAIRRNALVALGNIRSHGTMPLLEKYARDNDPILAKSARWAMARF